MPFVDVVGEPFAQSGNGQDIVALAAAEIDALRSAVAAPGPRPYLLAFCAAVLTAIDDPSTPVSSDHFSATRVSAVLFSSSSSSSSCYVSPTEQLQPSSSTTTTTTTTNCNCKSLSSSSSPSASSPHAHPRMTVPGLCVVANHVSEGVPGLPANEALALSLFQRCADATDCALALYCTANLLRFGGGDTTNDNNDNNDTDDDTNTTTHNTSFPAAPSEAARRYARVIDLADLNIAKRTLADMLVRGEGDVQPDPVRAAVLYADAIRHGGSVDAMVALAKLYTDGAPGVAAEPLSARQLLEVAVQRGGGARAKRLLGELLFAGSGTQVPRDVFRAVQLLRDAVDAHGCPLAMLALADALAAQDNALPPALRDMTRAVALYERAASRGVEAAAVSLGKLLLRGAPGVARDERRAYALLRDVPESSPNFAAARFSLALLVSSGADGVPQDRARAVALYEGVVRDTGSLDALFNIGIVLSAPEATVEEVTRAVRVFERVIAAGGTLSARCALAEIYMGGRANAERKIDVHKAVQLYEEVVDAGWRHVKCELGRILTGLWGGVVINMKRGITLLEQSVAEFDNITSMTSLAIILYEHYVPADKDEMRALRLCEDGVMVGLEYDQQKLAAIDIRIEPQGRENKTNEDAVRMRKARIAAGDHLVCALNAAELLLSGRNIPLDSQRALRLCEFVYGEEKGAAAFANIFQQGIISNVRDVLRGRRGHVMDRANCETMLNIILKGTASCNKKTFAHAAQVLFEYAENARFLNSHPFEDERRQQQRERFALDVLHRAADHGDGECCLKLADVYMAGSFGVARCRRRAVDVLARAAARGLEQEEYVVDAECGEEPKQTRNDIVVSLVTIATQRQQDMQM